MSVTAAVALSVVYLPQPMLTALASSLGVSSAAAGIIATAVTSGYAIGIFFLVPLTDRFSPRKQISVQLVLLTAALVVTSLLPSVAAVAVGFLAVGLVANIAQLVIPTAGRLAPADAKGRTTGALVGALLLGIFGGRVVASVLVSFLDWRVVVWIFAALVLAVLPLIRLAIGEDAKVGVDKSYGALLLGALGRIRTSPPLVQSAIMTFFTFATFNSLWTTEVLQLTGHTFGWTVLEAGLFGLVGLAAGIVTPFGGRFIDRFGSIAFNGFFVVLMLVATLATIVDAGNIWLFGISTFVITWGSQSIQSSNRSRVLQANPDGPAQANTIFMVAVFAGGSVGAYLGSKAFAIDGMATVGALGTGLVILAIVAWFVSYGYERRHVRAIPSERVSA